MKVLIATCLTWLLVKVGSRLLRWSDDLDEWAGLGMGDLPEGIWIREDRLKGAVAEEDESLWQGP